MDINKMCSYTGSYIDKYQLTMAQVYFLNGVEERALFDYFFRKLPFAGGYAVFAGLDDLLAILENFHFNKDELDFLSEQGFHPKFINYLKDFQFKGSVYATCEGEIVFPLCPILVIEAKLIEAQIIETILLNILNFQTLIATKAARIRQVAGSRKLIDFGLRRAQGPAGYLASRAAYLGGFDSTSNLCSALDYHIPISGTMAHSFIQSYEDELTAFRDFAHFWPDNCILLVDTYNTLESGLPNAIKVAKEMQAKGHQLVGIRLDSGDLAYLAKEARQMLNAAGLTQVQIIASNQLDEYLIKSLIEQDAPIDIFGVGTSLVTGYPDAALDGVYKLSFANKKPRIKLSEDLSKISLPDKKQVYRLFNEKENFFGADVIALSEEKEVAMMHNPFKTQESSRILEYKKEPLLQKVMEKGKILNRLTLSQIRSYHQERINLLPPEYKRFENPQHYKVELSTQMRNAWDQLIQHYKQFL